MPIDPATRIADLTTQLDITESQLSQEQDLLLSVTSKEKDSALAKGIHERIQRFTAKIGFIKAFLETWKDLLKFSIDFVKMFNSLLQ